MLKFLLQTWQTEIIYNIIIISEILKKSILNQKLK